MAWKVPTRLPECISAVKRKLLSNFSLFQIRTTKQKKPTFVVVAPELWHVQDRILCSVSKLWSCQLQRKTFFLKSLEDLKVFGSLFKMCLMPPIFNFLLWVHFYSYCFDFTSLVFIVAFQSTYAMV